MKEKYPTRSNVEDKPRTLKDGVTPRPRNLTDAIEALESALGKTTQTNNSASEVITLKKERDELKEIAQKQVSITALLNTVKKEKEEPVTLESLSKAMVSATGDKLYALYERYKALEKRK